MNENNYNNDDILILIKMSEMIFKSSIDLWGNCPIRDTPPKDNFLLNAYLQELKVYTADLLPCGRHRCLFLFPTNNQNNIFVGHILRAENNSDWATVFKIKAHVTRKCKCNNYFTLLYRWHLLVNMSTIVEM